MLSILRLLGYGALEVQVTQKCGNTWEKSESIELEVRRAYKQAPDIRTHDHFNRPDIWAGAKLTSRRGSNNSCPARKQVPWRAGDGRLHCGSHSVLHAGKKRNLWSMVLTAPSVGLKPDSADLYALLPRGSYWHVLGCYGSSVRYAYCHVWYHCV